MGQTPIPPTQSTARLATLGGAVRSHWRKAAGYQHFLYIVGFVLVTSAVFHTGVLIVTGGTLDGDVSWRKPILFGEAFGFTAISVAWVMSFLLRRQVAGWLLAGALGIANLGEVLWVSVQQWRGVPSHFNDDTTLDAWLFRGAGVLIAFTASVVFTVTVWSLVSLRTHASLAWAIRVGMVLLSASQLFGLAMILNDGNTIGAAGAIKVPHALSLHGLQVLPAVAGLLMVSSWNENRRASIVMAASAGYTGLVIVTAARAFSGAAPVDVEPPAGLALLLSAMTLGVALALVARGVLAASRTESVRHGNVATVDE
jgi:hypothetical protein